MCARQIRLVDRRSRPSSISLTCRAGRFADGRAGWPSRADETVSTAAGGARAAAVGPAARRRARSDRCRRGCHCVAAASAALEGLEDSAARSRGGNSRRSWRRRSPRRSRRARVQARRGVRAWRNPCRRSRPATAPARAAAPRREFSSSPPDPGRDEHVGILARRQKREAQRIARASDAAAPAAPRDAPRAARPRRRRTPGSVRAPCATEDAAGLRSAPCRAARRRPRSPARTSAITSI